MKAYLTRQMVAEDRGVRVIRAYSNMTVGRVIFPPGMLREQLMKAGFVEPVSADQAGEI